MFLFRCFLCALHLAFDALTLGNVASDPGNSDHLSILVKERHLRRQNHDPVSVAIDGFLLVLQQDFFLPEDELLVVVVLLREPLRIEIEIRLSQNIRR